MKKQIFFIGSAAIMLMAGVAMTGCNKNEPKEPAKVQTYHVRIQAGKGDANQQNGPRRVLSLDGTTLNATWAIGEQVTVRNMTKEADLTGSLTAESDGVQTVISGDLTGTINAGDELKLKFLSPDYTTQEGTLEYIGSHCDYAEATIHVASVTYGSITFDEGIADFQNKQAVVKFTLKDGDDPIAATELVVEVDGASYTITPASATSEIFVALPGFSDQTITLTATVGSDTYTYTSSGNKTLENSKYYAITVGMSKEELVHGFSISPTQQIEFAHGNLQYQPSTGTWRIARNQYDYVGDEYAIASNGMGWTDGTVGTVYENEVKSNNVKLVNTDHLFDIVDENYDGWMDLFAWNTADNARKVDLMRSDYTSTSFKDWGKNPIYDPNSGTTDNTGTTWRTLTKDEYIYIFCLRPNAQQKLGLASIEGHEKGAIKGVMILSDDFVMPSELESKGFKNILQSHDYVEATPGSEAKYEYRGTTRDHATMTTEIFDSDDYLFNQNRYTLAEWELLEAAGAVFLPAAGRRDLYDNYDYPPTYRDMYVLYTGQMTVYWTSSFNVEEPHAWICTCDDKNFSFGHTETPRNGCSVRLVRDLN